jgi:pimeloyl-ACP methyl ester carboxylesterase
MTDTFVLLLHGLGAHAETLLGIEKYLNWKGYKKTHKLTYLVDILPFEECLDHVSDELEKIITKNEKIIVIGQSMGGVFGSLLHTKGWDLELLITIGSPLKGAAFVKSLKKHLPQKVQDVLHKPMYDDLITMLDNPLTEPPHDYHCFTMAWPLTKFDGCVYIEEAHFDKEKHTHLQFADHRTIFANPRLWWHVHNRIKLQHKE